MNKWAIRLIYTVVILLTVVVGYQLWLKHSAGKTAHRALPDMVYGPQDSDVSVVEFMDYRCAACRAAHPEVKKAIADHPDVRFTIRHLPVFGTPSIIEADMALVAARHGKFKDMHEILISRENAVSDDEILSIAGQLGLNTETFREEMRAGENGAILHSTLIIANALNIPATPTFLINNRLFSPTEGPLTAADLAREIAAARAKANGRRAVPAYESPAAAAPAPAAP